MNIEKFLRTTFFIEHLRWLLLNYLICILRGELLQIRPPENSSLPKNARGLSFLTFLVLQDNFCDFSHRQKKFTIIGVEKHLSSFQRKLLYISRESK